jgi:hypothetical protein
MIGPVLRGEADLVIGSRYLEHTCQVPRHRVLGHRFFNWLTRASSGVNATDSQSGFRAFSPQALSCAKFHSQGFSVESEMQFIAGRQALRVTEVPITIRYQDKAKRLVVQAVSPTGIFRATRAGALPGRPELGYGGGRPLRAHPPTGGGLHADLRVTFGSRADHDLHSLHASLSAWSADRFV